MAAAERLIAADPDAVRREGGPHRWEPLLYAAYTRVPATRPGQSTLEVARLLLAHGADPNSGYLWEGLPSPFTALTGAFGRGEGDPPPHEHEAALATLLLEAGADPNDAQTIYNCSLVPGQRVPGAAVAPRLRSRRRRPVARPPGAGPSDTAGARAGRADLGRLLRQPRARAAAGGERRRRVDGDGTRHPITGRRNPLALALSTGNAEIADLLLAAGAAPPALDPVERFAAAAMRGDRAAVDALAAAEPGVIDAARAGEPGLIARAAEHGRLPAVRLLAELGFDVNHLQRKTALHEAAWRGDLDVVEALLELGADPTIADRDHHATAGRLGRAQRQDGGGRAAGGARAGGCLTGVRRGERASERGPPRHEAVVGPGALAAAGDEAGAAQDREVVADRRLREARARDEVADADLLAVREAGDERDASGIGERLEAARVFLARGGSSAAAPGGQQADWRTGSRFIDEGESSR